jgi:hypothetical protein
MSVEEVVNRLLEIARSIGQAAKDLEDVASKLSSKAQPSEAERIEALLRTDLGANLQHVDIVVSEGEVRVKPRRFLGSDVFRAVASAVRKHNGRWDGKERVFIIPARPGPK